jgi:hypothetical protein
MADLTMTQWRSWKTHLVPLLYDWFMNHELEWPSQACRYTPWTHVCFVEYVTTCQCGMQQAAFEWAVVLRQ